MNIYNYNTPFNLSCKIITIGDHGVGKTTILTQYYGGNIEMVNPTIGFDFSAKLVDFAEKKINVNMWDTANADEYSCFINNYFKNANGIILVYSVTDRNSFLRLSLWLDCIHNKINSSFKPCILLIGNKADLYKQREVTYSEAKEFSEINNILFEEITALDCNRVNSCFDKLINNIYVNNINTSNQHNLKKK